MRFPVIFLAMAISACSSDNLTVPPAAHATGLVLSLSSATIDTAGTLQVQSSVVWSDGAQHPATVTLSAMGGTISATGLYQAGRVAGRYLIVAVCTCSLTDTMAVTVAAQAGAPTLASLTISITGIPNKKPGAVSVTGPGGYHRDVTTSVTLADLAPGDYSLHATAAMAGADLYAPTSPSQSVTLAAADTKTIQFTYAKVNRPLATPLPAHPRVWMTPARVTFLQAQAAANTVRWQRVKANADAQVAKGTSYSSGDELSLGHLGLAYLATGDGAYATRAGVVLTHYAIDANDLTGDSGYYYRFQLQIVTMGLDWCYNGLTVAQRHQTATWLMNRADWVWPETNASRAGAWGTTDYQDNYYWGFMMSGPAALAAAGDDTGTSLTSPGSGSDRPTYHQTLALSKWNTVAVPYFAADGVGGGWGEGTGYGVGDTWYLGRFADAFLTVSAPLDHPWLRSAIQWLLHTTMPGWSYKVPFGDQSRVSTAPMFTYDRDAMLDILSAAKIDATMASQVQAWLGLIGQVPTGEIGPSVLTDELLHYDPTQAAASNLSGLPKDYLAQGDGVFIYRQSWTDPNATVLAFHSGKMWESHSGNDPNSLRIWKGSFWVSADANIYSHSGIEQAVENYNTLTVGGLALHHSLATLVGTPQVSDALVVVRGQAGGGYETSIGGTSSLSDYLRTVAYLPEQDVFVIVDRATVVNASQAKVWRWQVQGDPQVNGNTFRLQNPGGDARCFGSVLLPTSAVLGTQAFNLGPAGETTSHAVTVTLPVGNASDVVVTVLQCTTTAQTAPYSPTVTTNATETAVTFGIQRVTIPSDQAQPVRFETAYILRDP